MSYLSNGKVTYVYLPVTDLKSARTYYRDTVGLEEAWREGDHTCAFRLPGTEVQLMLDQKKPTDPQRAGLVFRVPSTDEFHSKHRHDLSFLEEPFDIPGGGRWVSLSDDNGHSLYVGDIE